MAEPEIEVATTPLPVKINDDGTVTELGAYIEKDADYVTFVVGRRPRHTESQ